MIWDDMTLPNRNQIFLKLAHTTSYGNWSWAKDSDGRAGIALEVIGKADLGIASQSKYFEVTTKNIPLIGNVLTVFCTSSEFFEIFYVLCNDLLSYSIKASTIKEALTLLSNRLDIWSKLFSKGFKGLSIDQIRGLIAELLILKKILIKNKFANINIWTGPLGTAQDFTNKTSNVAVEVKAVSKEKSLVKISSIDQLEYSGNLFLVTIPVISAKINDNEKLNIDLIVKEIKEIIGDRFNNELNTLLLNSGYIEDLYRDYYFVVDQPICYEVVANFPKITRSMVPIEIHAAKYELNLEFCSGFEVGFDIIGIDSL
jgi:hypothetical protein